MRDELFPFWEGKSVDEYCESQYRERGGMGAVRRVLRFRLLLPRHLTGGGDSNPGYDVILMKKGMLDIQQEAKDHLAHAGLFYIPDDLDKIYFYKSVIDTTEGVMSLCQAPVCLSYAAGAGCQVNRIRSVRAELQKIAEVNAMGTGSQAPTLSGKRSRLYGRIRVPAAGRRKPDWYVHRSC